MVDTSPVTRAPESPSDSEFQLVLMGDSEWTGLDKHNRERGLGLQMPQGREWQGHCVDSS